MNSGHTKRASFNNDENDERNEKLEKKKSFFIQQTNDTY